MFWQGITFTFYVFLCYNFIGDFYAKMLSYMRKAIENYNMINEGDKIAVGLSGGKDSITLLMGLKALQRFYPKKFEVVAISVNPGFEFLIQNF